MVGAAPTRSSCSGSCTRSCAAARFDPGDGIAFMLDQCHNIEAKIPAIIRSVMNVQEATAKALLVDRCGAGGRPGATATCWRPTPC